VTLDELIRTLQIIRETEPGDTPVEFEYPLPSGYQGIDDPGTDSQPVDSVGFFPTEGPNGQKRRVMIR
jgi:hypothetical protein